MLEQEASEIRNINVKLNSRILEVEAENKDLNKQITMGKAKLLREKN